MTRRELNAAGITDPTLRAAYATCRQLNARHGRTYFLATRLLPIERRPAVHALYGFARWADDIVDDLSTHTSATLRRSALQRLSEDLEAGLRAIRSPEPVVHALADTARRYGIEHSHFTDFLASMRSDLEVTDYADYNALRRYMHGSAAVIGLQMLPVLGTVVPRAEAAPYAAALGVAFQLTNFVRDVGEDLDRGRVYLPADLLDAHNVDRDLLLWSRTTGREDPRVTAALKDAIHLTRGVYREAAPGLHMLHPASRPCIRTAFILYGGILDAIAEDGYACVHRRAAVAPTRRVAIALDGLARVTAARWTSRRAVRGAHSPCAYPTHPRSPAGYESEPQEETAV
ncbi:phytoene/squalene synthase family protein [Streptomyces sp. SCSIO 30461]|uniref:phytoene/squalene synthase family protein n=1 Tax=Streptomyces sp. SCSIO 30461 TaxID=3118085 RepID=UPI0030D27E5E